MSVMGALFAASISIAILFEVCCAGSLPLYGVNFAVLYNHSSAPVPARRFPDQDSIPMDDYEYFSDLNINGVINGSIVIGAKNALYQLDQKLALESKFSWAVNSTTEESCLVQLHPRAVCQNHIRKYQKIPSSSSHILVCGTVADISPECVTMDVSSGRLSNTTTSSIAVDSSMTSFISDSPSFGEFIDTVGTGASNMDNRYFATGVGDNIRDFVIAYLNVNFDPNSSQPLNITRSIMARSTDTFLMRHPVTFVDYYRADYPDDQTDGDREFYFIFMRESYRIIQSEASYETIFSRVIRLCRNDQGNTSGNYISSFVKARIFCNLESPNRNRSVNTVDLQYNVITSMAFNSFGRFYERADERRAMYGAFISSGIGPTGSAICVYGASIGDADGIYEVFTEDVLDFSNASPSPVQNEFATCRNQRSDATARYYIGTSSIIGQIESNPLLVLDKIRVTQVAVDNLCVIRRTSSSECRNQDILILGTASGSIIKTVIASTDSRLWDPVISEEIQLDDRAVSVNDLKLQTIGGEKVAIVSTDSKIYQTSLARCGRHDACSTCIGSRDPYCVWNTDNQMCEINRLVSSQAVTSNFLQNVHTVSTFPTVYFLETMYFVSEDVGMINMTLNITSPQSSDVIVEVSSVDGSAQAGLDYMALNETLTIMAGTTSVNFSVNMLTDNVLEARNESFSIRIRGLGTLCIISGEDTAVVIQDSNNATLGFESSTVEVREDTGSLMLTVSRDVEMSTVDINFNVIVKGETATAFQDYCEVSKTQYTIPAGSVSSQNISIDIVNDRILESNESFIVSFELADNPSLQSRLSTGISQTVVTIQDDDRNYFGFDCPSYTFLEGDSDANLTLNVIKLGDSEISVAVSASLVMGTAVQGTDYTFFPMDLVFNSMEREKEINVTIMADTLVESIENFNISLASTSSSLVALGQREMATVYIQDNDAQVGFAEASTNVSVSEDVGRVALVIEASGSLTQPIDVNYRTIGGVATASSDFQTKSGTIPLSSTNPVGTIYINVIDDNLYEHGFEGFTVEIFTGGSLEVQNSVSYVTILDDDMVTVGFTSESASVTVDEAVGPVLLMVQSSNIAANTSVNLYYRTSSREATGNLDYGAITSTMLVLNGETTVSIGVNITDDSIYERDLESFVVELSTTNNRVSLANNMAVVSISDNDNMTLILELVSTSIWENSSHAQLQVNKSIGNEVQVNYMINTIEITAQGDSDFAPVSFLRLSFPPGSSTSLQSSLIAIIDDSIVEEPETFQVNLTSSDPRVAVIIQDNTVTIVDNDVYTIGFDCTSYTANEGDRLPLKIIKQGSGTLSVTVSFSPNTSNYSLSSQAVTFAANEMEKNVLVNIINDSYYEGQEIFNITMQSSSNRVQLTQHEAVITIQDQTAVQVGFTQSEYRIVESGGSVAITVKRTSATLTIPINLELRIISRTAIDGVDYQSVNPKVMLSFPEQSNLMQTYLVSVLNDSVYESLLETFLVVLESNSQGVSVQGISESVVTIVDDDMLVFRFESSTYMANEGSLITVKVLKQGRSDLPVIINITAMEDTASSNDYLVPTCSVTFLTSENEKLINVYLLSDTDREMIEELSLHLVSNDNERVQVGGPATISIFNVESGERISFARNEYRILENEGSVNLLVNRTTNSTVNVALQIIPLSAIAGSDYMADSPVTHTLSHSSRTDSIPIQIINDDVLEAQEERFLAILVSRDPHVSVEGDSTAVIIIQDNDTNTFLLDPTEYNLQEHCGYFNVTVKRTGTSALPIELLLSTPTTFSESSNYIPSWNFFIVVQPMQLTATAVVPIIDNSIRNEVDDEFSLTLSVGPTSESLTSRLMLTSASATVKVIDNDFEVVTDKLRSDSCTIDNPIFLSMLVILILLAVVLVVIGLCIIVKVFRRERNKTHPRRNVSPYSRETSTTVLGNINISETSSEGSPENLRLGKSGLKTFSKEKTGVHDTNIDASFDVGQIIHSSTSYPPSKEMSHKHDSALKFSSSPSSFSTTTKQNNGNELTLL